MAIEDVTATTPAHSSLQDPHSHQTLTTRQSVTNSSGEVNPRSQPIGGRSEETVQPSQPSQTQIPDARLRSAAASPDIEMTPIASSSESQVQSTAINSSNPVSVPSTTPLQTAVAHDSPLRVPASVGSGAINDRPIPNVTSTVDGASDSSVSPITPAEVNDDPGTLPQTSLKADDGNTQTNYGPSASAIGPSSDFIQKPLATDPSSGPVLSINLLLITGARHPFFIDSKYLKSRNVTSPKTISTAGSSEIDPFSISVYTLKELIHRDWRDDWDPRPTSPNYIRLIHFGRLLQDSQSLGDCRLSASAPNVIHMTVIPQDLVDDDGDACQRHKMSRRRNVRNGRRGARSAHSGNADGEDTNYSDGESDNNGCCRCIIQ